MSALAAILDGLEAHYGEVGRPTPDDPYEFVIFLNCGYPASDERCAKGFAALKAEVGMGPPAILAADDQTLVTVMQAGGIIPERRAVRLKQIAAVVQDRHDGDLKAVLMAAPAMSKGLLGRFPTLGDPAAERILLFCGLAPEAAPPASCLHVLVRLGLCEEGKDFRATYRSARAAIASGVAEDFAARQRAYLLLKAHGHGLCRRAAPRCEQCPVSAGCAYFQSVSVVAS